MGKITHAVATFIIASSTYFAAVAVPGRFFSSCETIFLIYRIFSKKHLMTPSYCTLTGVAVVWAILGSSLGMMIGFIVPSACYLKIRQHKGLMRRPSFGALILSLFSTAVAVACTVHALFEMRKK